MNILYIITFSLMAIGALNWGLVGLFNFDLVAALLGEMSSLSRVVYSLVGISALINVIIQFARCGSSENSLCENC